MKKIISKNILVNLFSILYLIFAISHQKNLSETLPSKFGLITVTHARGKDFSLIVAHINRYAQMECPAVMEINIVWNNQESMESVGVYKNNDTWRRSVYFYKTASNSMDWRYKVPSESEAKVYFSIDDDIIIDCEELMRGFKVWQSHAIGDIGPIVTYGPRYVEYTQREGFKYGRAKQKDMFSIGLVGVAFISRHFFDLYYGQIEVIKEMRKIVQIKNNCDDIALNFIIQFFYPELQTVVIQAVKGNLLAYSPKIAQSTSSNHYIFRNQCLKEFVNILGINPLRYGPISDHYSNKSIRTFPPSSLKAEIISLKREYLQSILLSNNSSNESMFKVPNNTQQQQKMPVAEQKKQEKVQPAVKKLKSHSNIQKYNKSQFHDSQSLVQKKKKANNIIKNDKKDVKMNAYTVQHYIILFLLLIILILILMLGSRHCFGRQSRVKRDNVGLTQVSDIIKQSKKSSINAIELEDQNLMD